MAALAECRLSIEGAISGVLLVMVLLVMVLLVMVVPDVAHALPLVFEPSAEVLPAAVLALSLAGRRGWRSETGCEVPRLIQVTATKRLHSEHGARAA